MRTLLLPPSSLFLLAAIGWLLHRRRPRAGRALLAVALLALYFLCTGIGSHVLVRPLENLTAPIAPGAAAGAQAIVVLGAGQLRDAAEYGGRDIPDYIALARLRYGAKLWRETGLPILVSGGDTSAKRTRPSQADAMASTLREDFLVPVRWIEGVSANTAENAAFSARILQEHGATRILLVTDAMHMARARLAFAQTGLEVVPAPTMFFGTASIGPFSLVPTAEGLRRSRYALHEWAGLLWYWLRYGG